ncbi:MAG TPA: hypothetical protein VH741_12250 [Candidatus Limnocylindrales bacterium]
MTSSQPPGSPAFPSISASSANEPWPAPRRWRSWLPLAVVGALAVVALIAVVVFSGLLGGAPTATRGGYAYVPDSVVAVGELRLDMPSGQDTQLVTLMRRLPTFSGQNDAQLLLRINDLIDEAVQTASGGRGSYDADVAPWFESWLVVAGTAEPPNPPGPTPLNYLLAVLGSSDRAAAESALGRLRPEGEWSSEDVGGVTVWSRASAFEGDLDAYAVTDDAVLISRSAADIRTALDVHAGTQPSLLDRPAFSEQLDAMPLGRLAAFWVDSASLAELGEDLAGALPTTVPLPSCAIAAQPTSVAGVLYLRDGNFVAELSTRLPADAPTPAPNRDTGLDSHLPADAFFVATAHDLGSAIGKGIDCLRDVPEMADSLAEIERQVGSLDDMTGWLGDTALAGRYDGTRATLGVVARVTDQTRAAEQMGALRTALMGMGGGVSISEADYNGTRVVTIDLGQASAAPAPAMEIAYAFSGDLLVIGFDSSFTRAVLDATEATSLRSNAVYRRSVERAGGYSNAGLLWLDIAPAVELWVQAMPPGDMPDDVGEYLEALESVTVLGSANGSATTVRLVLSTTAEE